MGDHRAVEGGTGLRGGRITGGDGGVGQEPGAPPTSACPGDALGDLTRGQPSNAVGGKSGARGSGVLTNIGDDDRCGLDARCDEHLL